MSHLSVRSVLWSAGRLPPLPAHQDARARVWHKQGPSHPPATAAGRRHGSRHGPQVVCLRANLVRPGRREAEGTVLTAVPRRRWATRIMAFRGPGPGRPALGSRASAATWVGNLLRRPGKGSSKVSLVTQARRGRPAGELGGGQIQKPAWRKSTGSGLSNKSKLPYLNIVPGVLMICGTR